MRREFSDTSSAVGKVSGTQGTPWIKCAKYLRLLIDYNISSSNHFDYITLKISKTVGIINKTKTPRYNQTRLYGHPLNMDASVLWTVCVS